ncbi:unnamed protein product [Brassicogethes aeneus]|uniref:Protogenin n=1 Tax=Brassicogethes aeneus TaxID=1431903 RepID=A0A9P0B2H3_BRAAE|nr:unnamed protein product [Brassicogethes aeneus]
MALRIFQLGIVFTIGFHFGPSKALEEASRPLVVPDIDLSLSLQDPQDVTVLKGHGATLQCLAESTEDGPVEYEWLRNGEPIAEQKTSTDGSLHFSKVISGKKANANTGEYQCLAKNRAGAILSNGAKLRVASIDKDFITKPSSVNVTLKDPVILHCKIHSTPAADIHWEFNNLPLPQSTRYVPLPLGGLLITKTDYSDSGSYRCVATNPMIKKTKHSNLAELTVVPPKESPTAPVLMPMKTSPNATVLLGNALTLYCAITGWPTPIFQWKKGNDTVISNSSYLTIDRAELHHAGNYSCTGSNLEGKISRIYSLVVYQKPYFRITPTSKSYPSAITVRLVCNASGIPQPRIYWLKNGKQLAIETRMRVLPSELIFSQTFTYDSGIYQCVAVNSVGKVWTAVEILINVSDKKPNPPQNVKCKPYNETSVCLTWQLPKNVDAQAYTIDNVNAGLDHPGPSLTNETFKLWRGLNLSTTYQFYVRLYSKVASDPSEIVSCETAKVAKRIIQNKILNTTTVKFQWEELISDTPCGGKRGYYKLQWRRASSPVSNTYKTTETQYVITDLIPGAHYEYKVTSPNYVGEKGQWVSIVLPNPGGEPVAPEIFTDSAKRMTAKPDHFGGAPLNSSSVKLSWSDMKDAVKYYTICYVPVKDQKDCKEGKLVRSFSNNVVINKLKPNTLYEFKIRTHNFENEPSMFSQAIEVQMPPGVPSPVVNLRHQVINDSTACIYWQAPIHKNGKLQKYFISYTPDRDWPLEQWYNISIPSYQRKPASCWHDNNETASFYLKNLSPKKHYTVLVRAASDMGIGNPTLPIVVTTSNVELKMPDKQNEVRQHQTIGVLVGIVLGLIGIICCVLLVLLRWSCVKRSAMSRDRASASNNYYPAVALYATQSSSVQVRLEDPCLADAHEVVQLVGEEHPANIPSVGSTELDTKGGEEYPNGQANGCVKPYMNGHTDGYCHITENPQYYACNLLHNKCREKDGAASSDYEEDSNSNVPTSKFYDLYRLFENSKKSAKVTSTDECSPHFEHSISNRCAGASLSNNELDSTLESENPATSLNSTQLTCLDDSIVNTHRRISPILGPNG